MTNNHKCICNKGKSSNSCGKWSEIPYYNESEPPVGIKPTAGSWPLFYFKRNCSGQFYNLNCEEVDLGIKNPKNIDFAKDLDEVIAIQRCLIDHCNQTDVDMALFWGRGVPVNEWTPIALELISGYKVAPPDAGRIMSTLHCAINDAFVITWYYKYLYCMPRPCQLDHDLKTILNTPRFPTYPSGHSVVSGACEVILSYYFPKEATTLKSLAEDASISRLYGGIHFRSDLSEGLSLGRRIGKNIINYIQEQFDCEGNKVDTRYYVCSKIYNILPPYYPCKQN